MRTNMEESSTHSRELEDDPDACRLCMMTGCTNMESIYKLRNRGNVDSSVAKRIAYVTQLNLVQGDGLPEKICQLCLYRLDLAETFIRQSKLSDETFRFQLMQDRVLHGRLIAENRGAQTSILAAGVGSSTYYPLDSRGHPIKSEELESNFIPPPLLNEEQMAPENRSESDGDAASVHKTQPSDNLNRGEYFINTSDGYGVLERVHRLAPAQIIPCPFCSSAFSDEHSMEKHSKTHLKQTILAMQSDIVPGQPSPANANTASVAQRRHISEPDSAFRSTKSPRLSSLRSDHNKRQEQRSAVAFQCSECATEITDRNNQSRHVCRPSFRPPIAKSSIGESDAVVQAPKVNLPVVMLPGQLDQLQSGQSVVLPVIKQSYSELKREHLRLERMKQQVREKLMPVREKVPVELTKLPPRPPAANRVICSPDLGVHTGSSGFRDDIKVEPGLEGKPPTPAVSSPRRTNRKLPQAETSAQVAATPCSFQGSAGGVVRSPGPKRNQTNVDYNVNLGSFNKKTKKKQ